MSRILVRTTKKLSRLGRATSGARGIVLRVATGRDFTACGAFICSVAPAHFAREACKFFSSSSPRAAPDTFRRASGGCSRESLLTSARGSPPNSRRKRRGAERRRCASRRRVRLCQLRGGRPGRLKRQTPDPYRQDPAIFLPSRPRGESPRAQDRRRCHIPRPCSWNPARCPQGQTCRANRGALRVDLQDLQSETQTSLLPVRPYRFGSPKAASRSHRAIFQPSSRLVFLPKRRRRRWHQRESQISSTVSQARPLQRRTPRRQEGWSLRRV